MPKDWNPYIYGSLWQPLVGSHGSWDSKWFHGSKLGGSCWDKSAWAKRGTFQGNEPWALWDMNTKDPGHWVKHRGNTIRPRKVGIQGETYRENIIVLFAARNLASSHAVYFFPPFLWGSKGILCFLWCAAFSPVTLTAFTITLIVSLSVIKCSERTGKNDWKGKWFGKWTMPEIQHASRLPH